MDDEFLCCELCEVPFGFQGAGQGGAEWVKSTNVRPGCRALWRVANNDRSGHGTYESLPSMTAWSQRIPH